MRHQIIQLAQKSSSEGKLLPAPPWHPRKAEHNRVLLHSRLLLPNQYHFCYQYHQFRKPHSSGVCHSYGTGVTGSGLWGITG